MNIPKDKRAKNMNPQFTENTANQTPKSSANTVSSWGGARWGAHNPRGCGVSAGGGYGTAVTHTHVPFQSQYRTHSDVHTNKKPHARCGLNDRCEV